MQLAEIDGKIINLEQVTSVEQDDDGAVIFWFTSGHATRMDIDFELMKQELHAIQKAVNNL